MTFQNLDLDISNLPEATRIDERMSKKELLDIIHSLMSERDRFRGALLDHGVDPDNEEDLTRFMQIEKPPFSQQDDKEKTRIKARYFAREVLITVAEVAECEGKLTSEQAAWFEDIDLILALN